METSDAELQKEMARRVSRHMLVVVLGIVGVFAGLLLAWRGGVAIFHGAIPKTYWLLYAAISLVPLPLGIASSRINLRCPACNESVVGPPRKTCKACNRHIFAG